MHNHSSALPKRTQLIDMENSGLTLASQSMRPAFLFWLLMHHFMRFVTLLLMYPSILVRCKLAPMH